jgi:hypothetical protein
MSAKKMISNLVKKEFILIGLKKKPPEEALKN